jgi:hypothetical protein
MIINKTNVPTRTEPSPQRCTTMEPSHHNDGQSLEVTVYKKHRKVIHDSDSDDNVVCTVTDAKESYLQYISTAVGKTNISTATTDDIIKENVANHDGQCTCIRCADNCKFLDITAKHVGTDTSGTTGSSDSDQSDNFICSEEENYTHNDRKQLKLMFPITAQRIMRTPTIKRHRNPLHGLNE